MMKIKIGKSDKLSVPGKYETTGTTLEVEFELPDDMTPEQRQEQLGMLKQAFEDLYWPLVSYDFETYLQRLKLGTQQFLQWKTSDQ